MNNTEDDMSAKKRGLGRGLDALLATSQAGKSSDSELPENQGELQRIPLEFYNLVNINRAKTCHQTLSKI